MPYNEPDNTWKKNDIIVIICFQLMLHSKYMQASTAGMSMTSIIIKILNSHVE